MLSAAPCHTDDVGDVRATQARPGGGSDDHPRQHLGRRCGQPQRGRVVGLVQVVEFGRQQHLRFVVEGGVVAEVEVAEIADLVAQIRVIEVETVEREDLGDFVAMGLRPSGRLPRDQPSPRLLCQQ